ncbi:MAG: aspartate kinase [Verrucomicrobia bacterium]|nr:aspartate kinase [Verrucomicrobiota bacterium]
MKFGGASVATPESFKKIAQIILNQTEEKIIVVVSAMGNTTDQLLNLATQVHPQPPKRELDMLVSVGERVSIALLAMALSLLGREAVSFTGSQSGIMTSSNHSEAKILEVRPHRLQAALDSGKIAIVAGFQGVSFAGEITTLGRGGSDTSAVALAAALGAPAVQFYKDVGGIYTADPKKDSTARILAEMSYDEALELSRQGAKVLHGRSIELAQRNGIELQVFSFDQPNSVGTVVGKGTSRLKTIYYERDI